MADAARCVDGQQQLQINRRLGPGRQAIGSKAAITERDTDPPGCLKWKFAKKASADLFQPLVRARKHNVVPAPISTT